MTVFSSTDPKLNSQSMDYNGAESQSTVGIVDNVPNAKLLKIISFTLLGITAILGSFILAAVYIQSSNKCVCGFANQVTFDNLHKVVQQLRAASENRPFFEPLTAASDGDSKSDSKLPVQLHMDGEAGDLMRNAGKGEMKCSVERKTAVQIIASEPKMLMTPYGNITTDPRLIHMTGEKMVITCGSNPKRDKKSKNILTAIKIEPKSIGDKERLEPRKKRSADKSEPKTKKECACDCSC